MITALVLIKVEKGKIAEVASKLGAFEEVKEVFSVTGDYDLVAKVDWLLDHPEERAEMQRFARLEFEKKYTATCNYQKLMSRCDSYRLLLSGN